MTTTPVALPSLEDILSPLMGQQRKFMLYRIADIDAAQARALCGVKQSEYNHWFDADSPLVQINRRREELTQNYRKEAIRLLRKDNQIAAILMEAKMIETMTKELDSRRYDLIKTPLAKDVYSKLVTDLDVSAPPVNPWQARLQGIIINNNLPAPAQTQVIGVIDGQHSETEPSSETECAEGELLPSGEQSDSEGEESV